MTEIVLQQAPPPIPDLRQELRIEPGAPLVNGAPGWTLFDPVRHAFYQLGRVEFRIFSRWARGELDRIGEDLSDDGLTGDQADAAFARVLDFSLVNQLTIKPMGETVASFTQQRRAMKKAWWRWMLDNYLFIRLPLVRPARWLEQALPRVKPLISLQALFAAALLACLGLLLVSRQWDGFIASFPYFFSWDGVLAYGLGLSFVKVIHELGHAFTATRFGCRVPSMGVSFLVMFPVLYTDTTGAWRLRSRKQRLAIDCAGVAAELMLASVATLAWVALPEGGLRSAAFVLATSSWALSLAVNLNPLMRFDGYYILSDLLGVPNLQPRSFALARWTLRELLFDLGDPPPELVPLRLRQGMVLYAWAIWIYRLILFTGIALLVYHMFFKLLGIVLFAVEIGVFVIRPIVLELLQWHARRQDILASPRGRRWLWIIGGLVVLACLPLDRHVSAVAILEPMDARPLVAGDVSRIDRIAVRNGQWVRAGEVIAELTAPEIAAYAQGRAARVKQLEDQLSRTPSDAQDLANRAVLQRELDTEREAAAGAERRRERLVLTAPYDGQVTDLGPDMHVGRWLNGAEVVARVVSPGRYDIQAYIAETDVWRIAPKALARFVPDDLAQPSRPGKLVETASAAVQFIDAPMLASVNGGPIAVNEDREKRLKPRTSLYRYRFIAPLDPERRAMAIQPIPGKLVIEAEGTSLVGGFLRTVTRIWRRENSAS